MNTNKMAWLLLLAVFQIEVLLQIMRALTKYTKFILRHSIAT